MGVAFNKLNLSSWLGSSAKTSAPRKPKAKAASEKKQSSKGHLKPVQVTFLFRHLSTLLDNGVSLPKAISTLAAERGTESYRGLLDGLRRRLENGETFSRALAGYPGTFDKVLISQVKIGERAGNLAEALSHTADQREKAGKLRGEILKKLAYPAVLVVAGAGVITFLLTYVVPVFEEVYEGAHVPLPGVTQAMIALGAFARGYLLYLVGAAVLATFAIKQLRRRDDFAFRMDSSMLSAPLIGSWLRDLALLQMMDVLSDLMQAGFTLAEALGECAEAVSNRAAKQRVRELQKAVVRGERFSREMERHAEFFPPMVSQLVIIGEQTGKLERSTRHIRKHLTDEIERKANAFVATIEPVLTIALASAVATVLMAIYLPMFDMINTVG
ncbi:MAG: type II secretion system F family protein [Bythopirellula sp.]